MKKFDPMKFYLGVLCKQGHDWSGERESLRYKIKSRSNGGGCVTCLRGPDFDPMRPKAGRKFTEDQVRKAVESYGHVYVGPYSNVGTSFKVLCKGCGKLWMAWLSHIRNGGMCSECGRRRGGRSKTLNNSVLVSCANCGEGIRRDAYDAEKYNLLFCGAKCKRLYFVGEDSPSYKHGESGTKRYRRYHNTLQRHCKEVRDLAKSLPEFYGNVLAAEMQEWVEAKLIQMDFHRESCIKEKRRQ